jgi:hypothetical protein
VAGGKKHYTEFTESAEDMQKNQREDGEIMEALVGEWAAK